MRSPTSGSLPLERASALVLLVFAGGAVLDALLRIAQLAGNQSSPFLALLLMSTPVLIALGVWFLLLKHHELSGTCLVMFISGVAVSWLSLGSQIPMNWYLGVGLILWAMRLGQNLLMWVGTSLLVLGIGAQFRVIDFEGALHLPFIVTIPAFLCVAAYFQFHQVQAQAHEIVLDTQEARGAKISWW